MSARVDPLEAAVRKRQKVDHHSANDDFPPSSPSPAGPEHVPKSLRRCHPHSIVTWNCNGLTSRCRWNVDDLRRLLAETHHPDLICLQEARLKAAGPEHQRGKPMDSEFRGPIEEVLQSCFRQYVPVWSLADNRYAGTLSLIHQRCFGDHGNGEDAAMLTVSNRQDISSFAAFTPQSAIDLLVRRLGTSRRECGLFAATTASELSESTEDNNSQSLAPIKSNKAKLQTSMKSFFAGKPKISRVEGENNGSLSSQIRGPPTTLPLHHPEGRFQFFFFPDMDVLQTYVPNNGTKEESFERRRKWDQSILQFLRGRKRILQRVATIAAATSATPPSRSMQERPLLWCGDLNVARDYRDGSHWETRPSRLSSSSPKGGTGSTVYEWWTDESKCFVQGDGKSNAGSMKKRPEDVGIPSFTPAERERFQELLDEGDFVDVWRELHPNGVIDPSDSGASSRGMKGAVHRWELPNYTWRGHLAINMGTAAKYQGKGQRLDYFLLSPSRLVTGTTRGGSESSSIVEACDILGYGERREGLFCGSDHCAVRLKLK